MLKMIVAAAVVVVITSTSAIAGIVLTQAAFARTSALNAGTLVDESQSFRMVFMPRFLFFTCRFDSIRRDDRRPGIFPGGP